MIVSEGRIRTGIAPRDYKARLIELQDLAVGWLDGHGLPPPPIVALWTRLTLDRLVKDGLEIPFIYPVEAGGFELEWPHPQTSCETSLTVTLARNQYGLDDPYNVEIYGHAMNMLSQETAEAYFSQYQDGYQSLLLFLRWSKTFDVHEAAAQ